MEPTASFRKPLQKKTSLSPLAFRSTSIGDVLKAVEMGQHELVMPGAFMPQRTQGSVSPARSDDNDKHPSLNSTLKSRHSPRDEEQRREKDKNVVLFPQKLRGDNRFFHEPALGLKATALVQESRRPSSLFSDSITSSIREDLNAIYRVRKYEDIKLRNARKISSFKKSTGGRNDMDNTFGPFRAISAMETRTFQPNDTSSTNPLFLLHLEDEEREAISERDKLGRRVEYGRMVGMFREEILASRVERYKKSATRHPEVVSHTAKSDDPLIDWSYLGMDDPVQTMDVLPRQGVMLASEHHLANPTSFGFFGIPPPDNDTVKRIVLQKSNPRMETIVSPARSTVTDPANAAGAPVVSSKKSAPAEGKSKKVPPTPATKSTKPAVDDKSKLVEKRKSVSPNNEEHRRKSEFHGTAGNDKVEPVTAVAPPPKKSQMWLLKYCFDDDAAGNIIDIQKGLVVIETGDVKYAFDPSKNPVSRDLDQEYERSLPAARRQRTRLANMPPEEREKLRIRRLLDAGKQYEGHCCTLAHNNFTILDQLLTNSLATVLKHNLTKLDLSFNRIRKIDVSFLKPNQQEKDERRRQTLIDAHEQEDDADRIATLSSAGMLSDAQQAKFRDAFLQLRKRAVADLVDSSAPQRLFYSLQTLYLHGNPIEDISELWNLAPLRHSLKYFTFHGDARLDRQANEPKNRVKLLNTFPHLVQLNFTTLLPSDEEIQYSLAPQDRR